MPGGGAANAPNASALGRSARSSTSTGTNDCRAEVSSAIAVPIYDGDVPLGALLAESARRPLVMPIVLHSFVLGQPYRLHHFRRVVEHILRHRDRVWLTRPGDICEYIEGLPPGIVP